MPDGEGLERILQNRETSRGRWRFGCSLHQHLDDNRLAVSGYNAPQSRWGAAVGFFNWLGFVATVMLTVTLYEKRPAKLFWI